MKGSAAIGLSVLVIILLVVSMLLPWWTVGGGFGASGYGGFAGGLGTLASSDFGLFSITGHGPGGSRTVSYEELGINKLSVGVTLALIITAIVLSIVSIIVVGVLGAMNKKLTAGAILEFITFVFTLIIPIYFLLSFPVKDIVGQIDPGAWFWGKTSAYGVTISWGAGWAWYVSCATAFFAFCAIGGALED